MYKKRFFLCLIFIIVSFYNLNATNYYYESLDSKEKLLYDNMLTALKLKKEFVDDNLLDFEKVSNVYYSVLNDNPHIFYISNKLNYSTKYMNNELLSAKVFFNYKDFDNLEIENIESELNKIKFSLFFDTIGFTNFEIVKYCFEYLCDNSTYDINQTDQSLVSVLVDNKGVCSSYAKSFQYLMDFFNIPCMLVEGRFIKSNENHVWNIVKLDGHWYHIDVTQSNANNDYIDYSYFCILDYQIKKDHIINDKINNIIWDKKTLSDKYFYLKNINCYFEKFSAKNIQNIIKKHIEVSKEPLIFMFENNFEYNLGLDYLINEKGFLKALMNFGYKVKDLKYHSNDLNHSVVFIINNIEKEDDLIIFNNYSKSNLKKEIINHSIKGNRVFKMLFKNLEDFENAKKILFEDEYIFELINNITSIEIKYYDGLYRFDLKI